MGQVGSEPEPLASPAPETAQKQRAPWKVALGQVAGGVTLGLFWAMLAVPLARLVGRMPTSSGWDDLAGALLGMIIGYPLGVLLGVWAVGRVMEARGSMWRAVGLGLAGTMIVLVLAEPLRLGTRLGLFAGLLIALPPLLATWGYHLGRQR